MTEQGARANESSATQRDEARLWVLSGWASRTRIVEHTRSRPSESVLLVSSPQLCYIYMCVCVCTCVFGLPVGLFLPTDLSSFRSGDTRQWLLWLCRLTRASPPFPVLLFDPTRVVVSVSAARRTDSVLPHVLACVSMDTRTSLIFLFPLLRTSLLPRRRML